MKEIIDTVLPFLALLVGGVGTYAGVRYTGRSSVQAKRIEVEGKVIEVEAEAYARARAIDDGILQRMTGEIEALKTSRDEQGKELRDLKAAVDKISRVFRIAINFIEQMLLRDRSENRTRLHIPEELHEYLDSSLLREHTRQQDQPYL